MSWLQRLKDGLSKTRTAINQMAGPLGSIEIIPEQPDLTTLEDLEFALIGADVGAKYATEILNDVRAYMKQSGKRDLREALSQALAIQLEPDAFRAKLRQAGFTPDAKKSTVELKGKVITRLGKRHKAEPAIQLKTPRNETVYWVGAAGQPNDGGEGTDFYAIANHQVSISPIQVDLTKHSQIDELKNWLNK